MQRETEDKKLLRSTRCLPTRPFLHNPSQNTPQHGVPCDTCPATHLSYGAASSKGHALHTNPDGPRRAISLFGPFISSWAPSVLNAASKIRLNHPLLGKLFLPSPSLPTPPAPRSELRKGQILPGLLPTTDLLNTCFQPLVPRACHQSTGDTLSIYTQTRKNSRSPMLANPEPSTPKAIYLPIPSK